jgi:hypothetical protein
MQRKNAPNRNELALLATLLMLACGLFPMLASADVEPNDVFATAESIPVPSFVSGHINATDKDDIYRFQVTKGTTVSMVVQPEANKLGVNLYLYQQQGPSGNTVEVAADRAATVGFSYGVPRSVNYTCNSTYDSYWMFAWVGMYKGEGTYTLNVKTKTQNDAGTGTDAGDTYKNSTTIAPGSYKGFVSYADDIDMYKLVLVKGDSIYVTVTPEAALSVNLYLMREVNNDGILSYPQLAMDKRTSAEGRGQTRHVSWILNSKESTVTMFVKFYRDQDLGNYSFNIVVNHKNDGSSATDAGDDAAHAYLITASGSYPGFLKDNSQTPTTGDTLDFYQINLTDRQKFFVNITAQNTQSIALTLMVNGNTISEDRAKHPELELGAIRRANYTMPRTHASSKAVLKVELDSGNGNYTMAVSIVPKPVDKDAPVVILTDPAPPKRTVEKIRLYDFKGTATDYNEIKHIELSFDRITWYNTTLKGDNGQYTWNCTVRFLHKGNNTLYLRATDDQGNTGETGLYVTYTEPVKKGFIPGFEAAVLVAVIVVTAVLVGRKRSA